MATAFKELYEQMELIKDDTRLRLRPSNLLYKLYYDYLKKSISLFWRDCYQDIKNHTPFSQNEYFFISNGTDGEFSLSPAPTNSSNIYVGYAKDVNTSYTEIPASQYSYNSTTNVLTISSFSITSGYSIYIATYDIGSFNDDLDLDVQNILIEGMVIPYLEEQQNRNTLLNQIVYGSSEKMASQAEHLKQVHTTVADQERKVHDLITNYTYRADPLKLSELGATS